MNDGHRVEEQPAAVSSPASDGHGEIAAAFEVREPAEDPPRDVERDDPRL